MTSAFGINGVVADFFSIYDLLDRITGVTDHAGNQWTYASFPRPPDRRRRPRPRQLELRLRRCGRFADQTAPRARSRVSPTMPSACADENGQENDKWVVADLFRASLPRGGGIRSCLRSALRLAKFRLTCSLFVRKLHFRSVERYGGWFLTSCIGISQAEWHRRDAERKGGSRRGRDRKAEV